jgi:predicted MFS family arabinose efflux permease
MRIGGAFYHPVGTSWITREYAGKYLETALGIQSGVGNFGVIIALGTTGFLGEMFTWKAPCLVWAGLNFTAVLLGLALIKEEGIKTRVSKQTKRVPSKSTLSKMWFLVIPIIAGGALYQVTSYFGPVRLTEVAGWSAGNADLIFAMWIGIGTITSYYFGAMSYRFGKTRLLLAGYIVSAIAAVILAFALDWFIMGPVLLIYGAFLFITFPALFSTLNDVTDESERGTAFGLLFGFQLGGGAFVVYICGIVVDALDNPDYAFVIVAILAAASAITMFTKNLSQRGRSNLESTGSDLSSRV